MRFHGVWAGLVAACAVVAQPARAESPSAAEADPISLADLLARDLTSLLAVARPSPIHNRARGKPAGGGGAARAGRGRVGAGQELEAFCRTQTGPHDAVIAGAAEAWGLDPFLLKGLLENESGLDAERVGKRIYRDVNGRRRAVGGGARGIGQFTSDGVAAVNEIRLRRHRDGVPVRPFTEADVMDPHEAIFAAAELLSSYVSRFGLEGGVTAYNSGPYGGRLVARHGFYGARRTGWLSRRGETQLQGHRFLLNVLRKTNRLRRDASLTPLPYPERDRTPLQRSLDHLGRRFLPAG